MHFRSAAASDGHSTGGSTGVPAAGCSSTAAEACLRLPGKFTQVIDVCLLASISKQVIFVKHTCYVTSSIRQARARARAPTCRPSSPTMMKTRSHFRSSTWPCNIHTSHIMHPITQHVGARHQEPEPKRLRPTMMVQTAPKTPPKRGSPPKDPRIRPKAWPVLLTSPVIQIQTSHTSTLSSHLVQAHVCVQGQGEGPVSTAQPAAIGEHRSVVLSKSKITVFEHVASSNCGSVLPGHISHKSYFSLDLEPSVCGQAMPPPPLPPPAWDPDLEEDEEASELLNVLPIFTAGHISHKS